MWPYWLLFAIPAITALSSRPLQSFRKDGARRINMDAVWLLVLLAIALMIGLRDRVGGDWYNYFASYMLQVPRIPLERTLTLTDPAYWALNKISYDLGLGILGVNLFGGFVFATGLILYCRALPRPWLALTVAIPYTVIVVSMGYSRQGTALGFALLGLVALGRKRFLWFAFWIMIAAAFHRSAALLMGIALLTLDFRKLHNLPILLIAGGLVYTVFLEDSADELIETYIQNEEQSSGALIRLAMNAIPAGLFLMYRKRLFLVDGERKLYSIMSFLALSTFLALITGLAPSTALDRMGLYLLPLQAFVYSHITDAIGRRGGLNQVLILYIIGFYAAVMFVWFNFGTYSHFWVPYRMFPTLDIFEAWQMQFSPDTK